MAATLTIFLAACLGATSIPGLDLPTLVRSSDLIVAGQIMSVNEQGKGTLQVYGQRFSSIHMMATIRVEEVLKGAFNSPFLEVTYDLPVTPAGSIGYRGLNGGTYRLVMLRNSKEGYEFVSPFYPSFPAPLDPTQIKADVWENVIGRISAVLKAPTSQEAEKLEAISALHGINSPAITDALRRTCKQEGEIVKLGAVAELLNRNDISVLAIAVDALMHPKAGLPAYIRQNLAGAIGTGVANDNAVPALTELLRARDAEIRRNAASALRNTASGAAIPSLVTTLSDGDFRVRYYGVIGLAEITGEGEWRPLLEDFQRNQDSYLKHWKQWAKNNRY